METMATMTGAFSRLGSDAATAGMKQVAMMVRQQALVLSFGDVFLILTFLFVGMACLVPLIKKPQPAPAGAGGGH